MWPGRAGVLVFLATLLGSFAVWCLSTPAIAGQFFGRGAYVNAYSHPLLSFFGLPLLALLSFAAGFVSPRSFWLWGFSANLLPTVAQVLLPFYLDQRYEGFRERVGHPEENLSFGIAFAIMLFVVFGLACTIASALGAGLRLAGHRLLGRRTGRQEGGGETEQPARACVARALGRVAWGAVLLGALAALLFDTVVGGVAQALFLGTFPWESPDRKVILGVLREPVSLIPAFVVSVLVGFLALLLGGYLAGRLLGRRENQQADNRRPNTSDLLSGGAHGLLVATAYLALWLVVGGALGLLVSGIVATDDPAALGIDPAEVSPTSVNPTVIVGGLVAALVSLALTFLGGYFGGMLGERRGPSDAEPGRDPRAAS